MSERWNKEEYAARAKEKDKEAYEHAKTNEEAIAKGHAPKKQSQYDNLPKPTEMLKARADDLELNKNLGKTMLVTTTTTGKGPRGAGFYCELCNRTFKDSLAYLDHVNGKLHLMKLGQTTQVERSTLFQVRAKIASLRAATQQKVSAKNFDFQERLRAVRSAEDQERARRKEERAQKKKDRLAREERRRVGIVDEDAEMKIEDKEEGAKRDRRKERREKMEKEEKDREVEKALQQNEDMSAMMGFGGFGSTRRK